MNQIKKDRKEGKQSWGVALPPDYRFIFFMLRFQERRMGLFSLPVTAAAEESS